MLKLIRWNEFMDLAMKCKGIVCIGAGRRLTSMAQLPVTDEYLDSIKYIADNNKHKQGTLVEIGSQRLIVTSVEQLKGYNLKNMVILITVAEGYYDIVEQLKIMGVYDDIDIYCLSHIKALYMEDIAMSKKIPDNIRLSDKMLIPKKIHYCWFGGNSLPDKYKKWMESWKKYCPDYEIIEWNEDNYDITKNKYMYDAYRAKKWGFVPDYARLDIIYNYGGIYLDTDIELVGNLDDLLYENAFAGFESDNYVNLGSGFGAQKGNILIKTMRDFYDKINFYDSQGNLDLTPSPVFQTMVLKENGLKVNGQYQILKDIVIYPEKLMCGKSLATRRIKLKDYTKVIHHYDASWLDKGRRTESIDEEIFKFINE